MQDGGRRLRGPLTSSTACLSPGGRQEDHFTSDLITSHPHNPKVLSQKVDSLINLNPSPPLERSPEDFLAVFICNVKGWWCKWLGRLSTATVQLLRYSTNLISPFFLIFFFFKSTLRPPEPGSCFTSINPVISTSRRLKDLSCTFYITSIAAFSHLSWIKSSLSDPRWNVHTL